MRYMLLLYGDESRWAEWSEEERESDMKRWYAYGQAMTDAGVTYTGDALQGSGTATTVRADGDRALTSDGPFAEAREQLGGYYTIDVADLDSAIEWARRCPIADYGAVEVRPIQEFPEA